MTARDSSWVLGAMWCSLGSVSEMSWQPYLMARSQTGTFPELIRAHLRTPASPNGHRGRRPHPTPPRDLAAWQRLDTAVSRTLGTTRLPTELTVYRDWAPQVARFSFRTGHLV
ncbi:hypothetical protein [Sphaerisporangium perillae]|uniref:hypothetical protein n=1 Tax=Sphaerisporangium perillae TaxID=2935860 RepID=UPI00200FF962|nr:hypothetical protein [Sphaerisporangium perillae]